MQFALIKIRENVRRIISAEELLSLEKYGDKIKEIEFEEKTEKLRIVYGAYLSNIGIKLKDIEKEMIKYKGYQHCWISKNKCIPFELCDYVQHGYLKFGKSIRIPFTALIMTDKNTIVNNKKRHSIPGFLRYQNMIPADNILNRTGIFCIQSEERRIKKSITITRENWKYFIDIKRAIRTAKKVY